MLAIRSWEQYVHPRAREFFQTHDRLTDSLLSIAKNIHYTEDPILVSHLSKSLVILLYCRVATRAFIGMEM